jgi:hypothetical protein
MKLTTPAKGTNREGETEVTTNTEEQEKWMDLCGKPNPQAIRVLDALLKVAGVTTLTDLLARADPITKPQWVKAYALAIGGNWLEHPLYAEDATIPEWNGVGDC